ncbi:hypothetical protein ACQ4PT_045396 [Festuca glaucescens]
MASITGAAPPSSVNAPAVGGGDVQQSGVMPSGNNDSPRNAMPPAPMNPLLLASACFGSLAALKFLFAREDAQDPPMMMPTQVFLDKLAGYTPGSTGRTLTVLQASDDVEDGADQQPALPEAASHVEDDVYRQPLPASARLLEGVTAEGDTALHVVVTNGDSTEFLDCASIINERDKDLLFAVNRKGDTPMHWAARAGKSQTVSHLIELAGRCNRVHELLRKENGLKETALHDAVRIGKNNIVKSLLEADPELANYPKKGTSPLYLAISLRRYNVAWTLHDMSDGNLSYHGPQGQNALHAAVLRGRGITEELLKWNSSLTTHVDKDGSTPLHFASSFWNINGFRELLKANPIPVYMADNNGLFPIHVAASVGAIVFIKIILEKCPSNARLCTAQGQTFLHVAVKNRRLNVVSFVCKTPSLNWILNMPDSDGNTALHLAVQDGNFRIFCSLYGNKETHLSLANTNKDTPIDLARSMIPRGLSYNTNNDKGIYRALIFAGAEYSCRRVDKFGRVTTNSFDLNSEDAKKEAEKVKDSSQTLGIGSVLITTVAFGATFALPGGYIADDRTNGGTPTRAGSYAFDAFMMANALAFVCSSIATIGLMFSGTSMVNLKSRQINLGVAVFFMSNSLTSLAAAFALGVYVVLTPVAHGTATVVCVLSPLAVLYKSFEVVIKWVILARPMCVRIGLIRALKSLGRRIFITMFMELWPFIFIFGWAAIAQSQRGNHR